MGSRRRVVNMTRLVDVRCQWVCTCFQSLLTFLLTNNCSQAATDTYRNHNRRHDQHVHIRLHHHNCHGARHARPQVASAQVRHRKGCGGDHIGDDTGVVERRCGSRFWRAPRLLWSALWCRLRVRRHLEWAVTNVEHTSRPSMWMLLLEQ